MMKNKNLFQEIVDKNFEPLDLYTTAITRAHGKSHPETFKVRELFEVIITKVKEAGTIKPDLRLEFSKLRQATDNYTIPEGICETYASVYNMLSKVDQAYQEI